MTPTSLPISVAVVLCLFSLAFFAAADNENSDDTFLGSITKWTAEKLPTLDIFGSEDKKELPALSEDVDSGSIMTTIKTWTAEKLPLLNIISSEQNEEPSTTFKEVDSVTYTVTITKWVAEKVPVLDFINPKEKEEPKEPPPPTTFEKVKKFAEDWKVAGTTAATVAGSAVTSTLGTAAGFTASGIVKGSVAATMQSYIGTSAVFATLQSLGATGVMAMLGPVGLVGGAVAGAGYYLLG